MKLFKLLIGFFCIMFLSAGFIFNNEHSTTQFKTFDEYELKGVPFTDDKEDLYVLVDKQEDTIKVQISNDLSNPIFYINKKDYWYSLTYSRLETTEDVFAMEYNEKYIYNDTILNYNYLTHKYGETVELGSNLILVETKDRTLYLFYDWEITQMIREKDDVNYRFRTLKKIVDNYKDIFIHKKYPIIVYPVRYYYSYHKVIRNDTLFLYDDGSTKNSICLEKARLLNSLGEFDPAKGKDIFGKIRSEEKCK